MATSLLDPVLNRVASSDGAIDPRRLAETLLVTVGEIADLAGVHRSSLTRNPGSPEIQRRLGPIATILSRAAGMGGGLDKAVIWFRHQPIAALGHARAADLVRRNEAGAVLDYLDALENGAYA